MKITVVIISFLFISSCRQEDKLTATKIVETASKNTSSDFPIKRLRNTQDIVDGMYSEILEKNKQLKDLDKKIAEIHDDSKIMNDLYNEMINNSKDYYLEAYRKISNLHDPVAKKEVLKIMAASSEKFENKISKLKKLKDQMRFNNHKIYAYYNVLKVRKTLPEIEKYQNAHPLKTDSLEKFIVKTE